MSNRIVPSQGPTPGRIQSAASFLPTDYVKGKHEFRANIICLGLFAVVMAGVVGAYFVTNRERIRITREQEQIQTEYAKEKDRIEQLAKLDDENTELLQRAEVTTALIEQIPRSVLMSELVNRLPENITLTEVILDGKREKRSVSGGSNASAAQRKSAVAPPKSAQRASRTAGVKVPAGPATAPVEAPRFEYTLKVIGLAQVNNQITDYLKSLKESPILENVDLRYIKEAPASRGESSEEFRQFEIQAQFKRGADGRRLMQAAAPATGTTPAADAAATTRNSESAANPPVTAPKATSASTTRPAAAAVQGGE